jgi:hypothetical protein
VAFAGAVAVANWGSSIALAACPEVEADADTLGMIFSRYGDDVGWMVVVEGGRARRATLESRTRLLLPWGFLAQRPRSDHVLKSSFLKSEHRRYGVLINCKPRTMERLELVATG